MFLFSSRRFVPKDAAYCRYHVWLNSLILAVIVIASRVLVLKRIPVCVLDCHQRVLFCVIRLVTSHNASALLLASFRFVIRTTGRHFSSPASPAIRPHEAPLLSGGPRKCQTALSPSLPVSPHLEPTRLQVSLRLKLLQTTGRLAILPDPCDQRYSSARCSTHSQLHPMSPHQLR